MPRKQTTKPVAVKLESAGIHGYEAIESVILASLVTTDPLLLIGRHYNASMISFDDLVGFPYPSTEFSRIDYLQTPATVWGAESVLIDEISRCKPEHQNRLFSLVQEKRIQGIKLDKLIYRWAAMNPCGPDQSGDSYDGSEPLDQALADRFAFIVDVPDWSQMSDKTRTAIAAGSDQDSTPEFGAAIRTELKRWRSHYDLLIAKPQKRIVEYCRIVSTELGNAGVRISPPPGTAACPQYFGSPHG